MTTTGPQEPFKRISVEEAEEMIAGGDVQIIDVRQPGEYEAGHLSGAKLIPVDDIYGRVDDVSEDKDVIFLCAVGVRSALACEIAVAMGRNRCHNVEGGMEAWKAKGLPFESGPYQA